MVGQKQGHLKVKFSPRVIGENSKYQTTMKNFNKSKILAFVALMLARTILASAATIPSQERTVINEDEYLEYDDAYLSQIDSTVDQYFEEHVVEFQEVDYVKVFDANQELLVEGV